MKIVFYGGTFNPPHLGHRSVLLTIKEYLNPDLLLVVPNRVNPFKDGDVQDLTPRQRLDLCRIAFGDIPGVEISDIEIKRRGKSRTSDTVELLKKQYEDADITLVIGSDLLEHFDEWNRFDYLAENCTIAVLSRSSGDDSLIDGQMERLKAKCSGLRITKIPHTPIEASSTQIREQLSAGQEPSGLDERVYEEIIKHHYYQK